MDDFGTESDSDYTSYWKNWFMGCRGNEYFSDIDDEYLNDKFNLTNLNADVQYYSYALDMITDAFEFECDDTMRDAIEKSARHLYGLIHARYILSARGLSKMLEKFKRADFGRCPRALCNSHPVIPTALSDISNTHAVKLYCAKCEDCYNPKSSRHAMMDGAYFGTSFAAMFFQTYPNLVPEKQPKRYVPTVFGFKVHHAAALARWQESDRRGMIERLDQHGIHGGFKEPEEGAGDGDGDESMMEGSIF